MSTHAVIAIDHLGVYIHYDGTRGTVLAYVNEAKARRYHAGESYGIARLADLVCEVLNKDGNGVGIVQVKDENTAESLGVDRLVRVKTQDWDIGFTISDLSPSELQDYYIVSDRLAHYREVA